MLDEPTNDNAPTDARRSHNGEGANKPVMVTVPEACRVFGVGRTKMWELIMSRAVDSRKLGQRTLISVASLEAYIESLPSGADRDQHTKVTRLGRPRRSDQVAV